MILWIYTHPHIVYGATDISNKVLRILSILHSYSSTMSKTTSQQWYDFFSSSSFQFIPNAKKVRWILGSKILMSSSLSTNIICFTSFLCVSYPHISKFACFDGVHFKHIVFLVLFKRIFSANGKDGVDVKNSHFKHPSCKKVRSENKKKSYFNSLD